MNDFETIITILKKRLPEGVWSTSMLEDGTSVLFVGSGEGAEIYFNAEGELVDIY